MSHNKAFLLERIFRNRGIPCIIHMETGLLSPDYSASRTGLNVQLFLSGLEFMKNCVEIATWCKIVLYPESGTVVVFEKRSPYGMGKCRTCVTVRRRFLCTVL